MADQELLELAAKAVGWRNLAWQDGQLRVEPGNFIGHNPDYFYWSPLTDDGAAFRLASKLNLTVEFGNNCVLSPMEIGGDGTEPLAATRRAIVRAAAEIGKSTAPEARS